MQGDRAILKNLRSWTLSVTIDPFDPIGQIIDFCFTHETFRIRKVNHERISSFGGDIKQSVDVHEIHICTCKLKSVLQEQNDHYPIALITPLMTSLKFDAFALLG